MSQTYRPVSANYHLISSPFWNVKEDDIIIHDLTINALRPRKGHTYLNKPAGESCRFFLTIYNLSVDTSR